MKTSVKSAHRVSENGSRKSALIASVSRIGIDSLPGSKFNNEPFSAHFSLTCSGCSCTAKSVRREFSDQVWAALVNWSEIPSTAVDQPICNDCYFNLRDVLIDRADEIQMVVLARNPSRSGSRSSSVMA